MALFVAVLQSPSESGITYRLMLLGRAAPVVNARLPLTEACAHGLRGLWPEAEDCHRQHRLCRGVHNSHAGVRSATLRSHLHVSCAHLYDGGVVCDSPRPQATVL